MQVAIPEARNQLSQRVRLMLAEDDITTAEGGEAAVRLVPVGVAPSGTIDTARTSALA